MDKLYRMENHTKSIPIGIAIINSYSCSLFTKASQLQLSLLYTAAVFNITADEVQTAQLLV